MNEILLTGCRVSPLSSYLKALAVLRLVAEQLDPDVRGSWQDDVFVLTTTITQEALVDFFLNTYAPSPVTAPWNGGSGYFPNDGSAAISAIENSEAPRFIKMKQAITEARKCVSILGLKEKPDPKTQKQPLISLLRNRLPDDAVQWMDAAIVLSDGSSAYPPILGTGGNDGRLEFTNNFMQRLLDVIDENGVPTGSSEQLLMASLFDDTTNLLAKGAIGQFNPSAAGGANGTTGFDSGSLINAWEFVLMIEGAISFSSTVSKRVETNTHGGLSSPFVVRNSSSGYGSAADNEDSRAEMWLPIWDCPTSSKELQRLLGEGRARVGRRAARNGLDFARAVAGLGVDRGIIAFERVGIQQRNGLSYFAVPLGRFHVARNPEIDLLNEIDRWLDDVFRYGKTAPARVTSAVNGLESAIFRFTQVRSPESTQGVLIAIGRVEYAVSMTVKKAENSISPISQLNTKWRHAAATDDVEWRLANALTSTTVMGKKHSVRFALERSSFEKGKLVWINSTPDHISEGDITTMLQTLVNRWLLLMAKPIQGSPKWDVQSKVTTQLSDINVFLSGKVDEARLFDLVRALMLVESDHAEQSVPTRSMVPAAYGLMRLCFSRFVLDEREVVLEPSLFRTAIAGKDTAVLNTVRRLRSSGLVPKIGDVHADPELLARTAAALAFPLSYDNTLRLKNRLIISSNPKG